MNQFHDKFIVLVYTCTLTIRTHTVFAGAQILHTVYNEAVLLLLCCGKIAISVSVEILFPGCDIVT
jgi:hypothetical protein